MNLQPVGVTGAPFGREVPVHPDPTLIQRPEQGVALARTLGDSVAVILRGHGAVIVGFHDARMAAGGSAHLARVQHQVAFTFLDPGANQAAVVNQAFHVEQFAGEC